MKRIKFLTQSDELADLININCNDLNEKLQTINIDQLEIDQEYKEYFIKCHLSRPIFSLRTSALLLYNAIKTINKPLEDIELLDYGAGISTVYVLAKKLGVGKVYYSDLSQLFCNLAKKLDLLFNLQMDDYIVGDSNECFTYSKQKGYNINLVVSRNVIEHIYDLNKYLNDIHSNFPLAIVYNSTTANWNNPMSHLQHVLIHRNVWKTIREDKKKYIMNRLDEKKQKVSPKIDLFVEKTRALGGKDFDKAIDEFCETDEIGEYVTNYTNVTGASEGWAENLLPYHVYKNLHSSYKIDIFPGIWDTNYSFFAINFITRFLNFLIEKMPVRIGNVLSPYIFVVAKPL